MRILILGGNGFIGKEVARTACASGHQVSCIGRDIASSRQSLPSAKWISHDITRLDTSEKWLPFLNNIDTVVNCAGALQNSPRDNITALQETALKALFMACEDKPDLHIVQISANTMQGTNAGKTSFLITKQIADEALIQSRLNYTILRPALVIGRNAHGGTALLRAIAAFPFLVPQPYSATICQTTNLGELAEICLQAAIGKYGKSGDFCVGSAQQDTLGNLTLSLRNWLGIRAAPLFTPPRFLVTICTAIADLAGILGWRSPMRSTAVKILENGVLVDPSKDLIETSNTSETLARYPAGIQDRWFAYMYLLKPVLILILAIFWFASGTIALFNLEAAAQYLGSLTLHPLTAKLMIITTAIADCLLGVAILFRSKARIALIGMCLLSIGYLGAATIFLPALWLDTIGPLVKAVPTIFLSLVTLAILGER